MRRQMRNTAVPEAPVMRTARSRFPGKTSLAALRSNIGLEEQQRPTYNKDETVLFENTTKVRRLVEQMERKEGQKDET